MLLHDLVLLCIVRQCWLLLGSRCRSCVRCHYSSVRVRRRVRRLHWLLLVYGLVMDRLVIYHLVLLLVHDWLLLLLVNHCVLGLVRRRRIAVACVLLLDYWL